MQMLKKLFNSDKKYYLELDEVKDSEVVQSAVKTAEKAADVVKEKTAEVAKSQPVQNAVETATEAVEAAQDKLASVVSTEEKSSQPEAKSSETKQTTAKAKSSETKQATTKAKSEANAKVKANGKAKQNGKASKKTAGKSQNKQAQSNIKNSGASSYDPPFWVAAMYNNNSSANGNGQAAEQTFAPDNLMPTVSKYRRRPGGSLAKFKNMARQAKTPRG